jgi:hypothetical protein
VMLEGARDGAELESAKDSLKTMNGIRLQSFNVPLNPIDAREPGEIAPQPGIPVSL